MNQEEYDSMGKIGACIILYNPDIKRLLQNINSISAQISEIVLVDNNSENIEEIKKSIIHFEKEINIIHNEKNIGIAAALNQGIFYLKNKKYEWVLTLDQDSICPKNLISEYRQYVEKEIGIGIISPIIRDVNMKKDLDIVDKSKSYELIEQAITSASLTNVDIWEKVEKFDEKLFIDMVDFDFCKRIQNSGYKIIRVNSVKLTHEIGNATTKKILWYNINVLNHSAFRKYYMARNIIYFNRKYNNKAIFDIKSFISIFKLYTVVVFFENDKKNKIFSLSKGLISGFKLSFENRVEQK